MFTQDPAYRSVKTDSMDAPTLLSRRWSPYGRVTESVQKQVGAYRRSCNHVLSDVSPFRTSTSAYDSF